MTPKFTPGPWHRNIKPARKYPVVFAGRNTHVVVVQSQGLADDEVEANCDLVKAAPALYQALHTLMEVTSNARRHIVIDTDEGFADYNATAEACNAAREALDLALGAA